MTEYSTDFTEYTVDAQPSDWTERWNTTYATSTVDDTPYIGGGLRALKVDTATTGRYAVSWDDIGTPSGDIEVLAKVSWDASGSSDHGRVFVRGGGSAGTEYGYFITFQDASTSVLLAEYNNGTAYTRDTDSSVSLTYNQWWWVRIGVSGNTVRAKYWKDGASEPGSWMLTYDNTSSPITSGWVGVGQNGTTTTTPSTFCDWFSVITGSGTAPDPDYTGNVFNWLESPVDITPSSGTWSQTDISSYITEQTTGVIVRARNTAGSGNYVGGVKPYISSTDIYGIIHPSNQNQYIVGHNYGYISCYYDANIDYELIGYIERAVFFLAGVDYAAPSGWNDWDITTYLPGESQAAFIMPYTWNGSGANNYVGYRKNGSTDARTVYCWSEATQKGCQCGVCIAPTDTASILEIYSDNAFSYSRYVLWGYIPVGLTGFTWNTNGVSRTLGSSGSYQNLTAASSDATTTFYQAVGGSYSFGLRPDGSSGDFYYPAKDLSAYAVECGPSGIVEAKVSNTAVIFYELGWEEGVPLTVDATIAVLDALKANPAIVPVPEVRTTYYKTVVADGAAGATAGLNSGIFAGNVNKVALEKKVGDGSWYEIAAYNYGEDQTYQDNDVEPSTWYHYRAARYSAGEIISYSYIDDVFINLPVEVEAPMTASASANIVEPYFLDSGIVIEKHEGDDTSWEFLLCAAEASDYYDDPGPFVRGETYYYRSLEYTGENVSAYSDEKYITFLGSIDISVAPLTARYTASFASPEVFIDKDILSPTMDAVGEVRPTRLIFSSIFGVEAMECSAAELLFYYAWGSGPSHTDHVPNPFEAVQAGVLAPVVIIPKTISTTVVLQGAASAGGAALLQNTKTFPDRLAAEARLAGGDDAHDIDGFIVTIRKTASSSPYTMGTTPAEETVHYVTPEKREFKLWGVPADDMYTMGVQAYRIVDPDVDEDGVLKSTLAQYPAIGQPPISADDVNYTGLIDDVAASTVASGAQQGADAYSVTSTAFDSGKVIATWQPGSATAVPYNFSGLFGNNSYLGYVTRGADPATPVWKTFLDSTGNFYLGGSSGSNSGLAWASASNDLSINFDNTTTGGITMSTKGYIKAGQTAYNTGTGFFLGYSTDAVKFSLGTSTQGITWDGTTLTVKGTVNVTNSEDFGNKNWTTQPQSTDAYNVGDLWLDTTSTPPKIWKCITAKAAGPDFDYAHWTISTTRAFSAQPTTPYAVGDIWFDTTNAKTYKCTVARASGSFVQGDWTQTGDTTKAAIEAGTTITGGYIMMSSGGKIYSSGKTTYNSATAGFFLGYTGSVYAFGIGDSSKYLTWDGSSLTFSGTITGSSATFGGITLNSSGISTGTGYFSVNTSGVMTCTNGNFSGNITSSSITAGNVTLGPSGITTSTGYFSVNTSGQMTCTNGSFSGTVTSSNANISGTLSSNSASFCSGSVTIDSSQMKFKAGSIRFTNSSGSERGYMTTTSDSLQLYGSYDNLYLTAYNNVIITSATGSWTQFGYETYGNRVQFGTSGCCIYSGTGSPSGATTYGSLYLSTGGSLWIYLATNTWKRIDNWTSQYMVLLAGQV